MVSSVNNVHQLHVDSEAKIDSVVSSGAEFEGNIVANKGVRIDGKLKGNITIKNQEGGIVVIPSGGQVFGNIVAPLVIIEEGGLLHGNINAACAVELNGTFVGDLVYGGKILVGANADICGMLMNSARKQNQPQPDG